MSHYTIYGEFLNQSYRKILEACLADQAIDTLKILQNKDYLLLRINELFSEIYVAQREKTIQQQGLIIVSLQKTQQTNKTFGKQQKCLNCEIMKQHISQLEDKVHQLQKLKIANQLTEEKSTRKIQSLLLKETEQLKKEIKSLQEQNIFKKIEFQEQLQKYSQQNNRLKINLKQEIEKSQKNSQKLKAKLNQIEQEKQLLQNQLFNQYEQKGKQQKDIRQLGTKYSNLNIVKQRQQNQINLIKNQNMILQQKLKRYEEENHFLREKNNITQRQIKSLKTRIDQLQSQNELLKNKAQQSNKVNHSQAFSLESINKRSEMQRKLVQSQKCIHNIKQQLAQKQKQFSQATIHNQKTILKLNDQLKKAQYKMDKQFRTNKEEYKKSLSKNIQDLESSHKQQRQELIRKYDKILNDKESLCQQLQQKILLLNRKLLQSQQYSSQSLKEFQNEKKLFMKQIKQQRYNYNELKKYYQSQRITEQVGEKQKDDKYKQLMNEKSQLEKMLNGKQKEIKQYKKQLLNAKEQQNSLVIKIENMKNKSAQFQQTIDEYGQKNKSLAEKIKQKDINYHQIHHKYINLTQEKQEIDKKIAAFTVNQRRLQQKIRRVQSQLAQKRQLVLAIQEASQEQSINVFAKAQQTTSQARKQLQSYYLNLLKNSEERISNASIHQVQKLQLNQIEQLKATNADYEQKLRRYKQKYSSEQKEKLNVQSKTYALLQENEELKTENGKILDLIHAQKKKNINLIKAYQQKMLQYYNNFSEFKRQFYLTLKQQLSFIKVEMCQIVENVKHQRTKYKQCLIQFSQKMSKEMQMVSHNHQLQIQKIRHQYQFQKILKVEQQKRQLKLQCQLKIKELNMQFYTILAQKQHQINILSQKQSKLNKKANDLQTKNEQIQRISREAIKKNEELRQIINKMNRKVSQSQRNYSSSQNQLQFFKKSNFQLKKQISELESNFKAKIQQCRQKYSLQNERLFAKYEKQFSKFIVSNKKSLQFSMLSNSCSNLHVPTKGVVAQGKLDKIQKQIEQQKKKLNILQKGMENKSKFDKTCKMAVQRDNPRCQKSKKY